MSLTINLAPSLEQQLREDAARRGLSIDRLISQVLEKSTPRRLPDDLILRDREAELLQKINLGITPEEWAKFHALSQKRSSATIGQNELNELIQLTSRIETANVVRLQYLAELADLRQVPLRQLMHDLGISPQNHE